MFVIGRLYHRLRDIHLVFGGQRQGGISTPKEHPLVFLFTGPGGSTFGYHDEFRPDGIFCYTGEGQSGDMEMVRGNRAIRYHAVDGRALHVFEEVGGGNVRYMGQASYLGHHTDERPDVHGQVRKTIVFELEFLTEDGDSSSIPAARSPSQIEVRHLWKEPMERLRQRALAQAQEGLSPSERRAHVYQRSEAVRIYVLRRADGVCERCGLEAPFLRPDGRPYLETHHIRRLMDGGPDDPRYVAGVCPNCHRAAHYADDADRINDDLLLRLGRAMSGANEV